MKYLFVFLFLLVTAYVVLFVLALTKEKKVATRYKPNYGAMMDSLNRRYDSVLEHYLKLEKEVLKALPDKKVLRENLPKLKNDVDEQRRVTALIDSIFKESKKENYGITY